MSQFDNLRDKAEDQMSEHGDQVEGMSDQGLDKGGDALDSATGGTFSDQIDQGQERGDGSIGDDSDSADSTDDSGS